MAEDQSSLHIDNDWKKQAQEEKKRLAEQQKQAAGDLGAAAGAATTSGAGAAAADPRSGSSGNGGVAGTASAPGAGRERGEVPPPTFATLVQSLLTQILFYLGELAPRGAQPQVNLDMAKHNIDLLNLLEEKTANNLTEEEKRLLDAALYETRMRYVSVASQFT